MNEPTPAQIDALWKAINALWKAVDPVRKCECSRCSGGGKIVCPDCNGMGIRHVGT